MSRKIGFKDKQMKLRLFHKCKYVTDNSFKTFSVCVYYEWPIYHIFKPHQKLPVDPTKYFSH